MRPFARPPDPTVTCLTEAEALEQARGENADAPAFALLVRYRDVAEANPPLAAASSGVMHPERPVWVVTVHADVMTRGGLASPPQLKHVYSLVIDAETGVVPDIGVGAEAVRDGHLVSVPVLRGVDLSTDSTAGPRPPELR